MQGFAHEHRIPESTVTSAVQIFKLAAMNNFIQGRRINTVAAVCLYTAARKQRPCRVMLIDFADSCEVNVFKLGHTFKALHKKISLSAEGLMPVLPEDLIYRFATKLEFDQETTKVAETAVRLVQRMSLDWISMGRRPSGICGACLIMAARMHNFRRTVKEVVYVVKVTTATIQKRLDEFKITASSELTVEEFLTNQFLESAHDPPSFYRSTDTWKAKQKKRKRKRHPLEDPDEDDVQSILDSQASRASSVASSVDPGFSINPSGAVRRDADGFAVPAIPLKKASPPLTPVDENANIDPALLATEEQAIAAAEANTADSLDTLAAEFGGEAAGAQPPVAPMVMMMAPLPTPPDSQTPSSSADATTTPSSQTAEAEKASAEAAAEELAAGKAKLADVVDKEWQEDEQDLEEEIEEEISEMIADPNTSEHARAFATAEMRARVHAMVAKSNAPAVVVPDSIEVEEGEFADDPEVTNCLLSEQEAAVKERIWVHANQDWLRAQQLKLYNQKMRDKEPKVKRNRVKKPRIGEGQTEPAGSAAEAAVAALKERAISSRLNYGAIEAIFKPRGGDTTSGTSSALSTAPPTAAPSVAGDSEQDAQSDPEDYVTAEPAQDDTVMDEEDVDADEDWQQDLENDELL